MAGTTIDQVTGAPPRDRTDVTWPGAGSAAVTRVRALAARWRELLATADIQTALWVNVELTKNIAEIGQLRLLRAAG